MVRQRDRAVQLGARMLLDRSDDDHWARAGFVVVPLPGAAVTGDLHPFR